MIPGQSEVCMPPSQILDKIANARVRSHWLARESRAFPLYPVYLFAALDNFLFLFCDLESNMTQRCGNLCRLLKERARHVPNSNQAVESCRRRRVSRLAHVQPNDTPQVLSPLAVSRGDRP